MPLEIDYYFAPISGYAYLGHGRLKAMAQKHGAKVNFRPMDIREVFKASETTPPAAQSTVRQAYRVQDMGRWAEAAGLPITPKPKFWPVDPRPSARVILAAAEMGLDQWDVTGAILSGVWSKEANIADAGDLADLMGLICDDPSALLGLSESMDARLSDVTDQAIEAGVFGSPSYVVGDDVFWGQDRLDFVEALLEGQA